MQWIHKTYVNYDAQQKHLWRWGSEANVTNKLGTQAAGGAANYIFGVFDVQIFT